MNMSLISVKPKTVNQNKIFTEFEKGKNLYIHGTAGTGKSYIAIYLALRAMESKEYGQVIIIRSAVPSRRQGFLPGNEEEKNEIFENPYLDIVAKLYDDDHAYKRMKGENRIKFVSTSYLRGITFEDSIIVVDEIQNFNGGEADTVMTRIGNNCRLIICGDTNQNDLTYLHEDSCIENFEKIVGKMSSFSSIEMGVPDICRNEIVREWIIARDTSPNNYPRFLKG